MFMISPEQTTNNVISPDQTTSDVISSEHTYEEKHMKQSITHGAYQTKAENSLHIIRT